MEPITLILLTVWVMFVATLWLVRILGEEAWAAVRGQESPRIARRRARDELARKTGVPTIGQALAFRLSQRIANPPERRLLGKFGDLLAEFAEDALAEARVRHQHAVQERAKRRAASWKASTGGGRRTAPPRPAPEPEPEPERDLIQLHPCRGCRHVQIPERGGLCDTCAQAADEAPAEPSAPEPEPAPDPEPEVPDPGPPPAPHYPTPQEAPLMTTTTHEVSGDVSNPVTALEFSAGCRGFNDAITEEMETLGDLLERKEVGPKPRAAVRVTIDAARTYSASNTKSEQEYAEHVLILEEIASDDDLSKTVRRTYLDGNGGDARVAARRAATQSLSIRAADCDSPDDAARLMDLIAEAYDGLRVEVEQAKARHIQQRVKGKPIQFLDEQLDHATVIAGLAEEQARVFRRHVQVRHDTVGRNDAVRDTQRDKWLDTAKA